MWLSLKLSVKKYRPRKWIDAFVSFFMFEAKYHTPQERFAVILQYIK
jgi:hypothetical protein